MLRYAVVIVVTTAAAGCYLIPPDWFGRETRQAERVATVARQPVQQAPIVSDRFKLEAGQSVVGRIQILDSRDEDTLSDIAREYNLGFEELRQANPGVDPWLPGEGTAIILPTQFILPDAPHEGLVLNIAAMRLFYFPEPAPDGSQWVITHPIGIGRVGWETPTGSTSYR